MVAAVSIVRDITAEHQAQRVLRNRDAEQRAILNTISDAVLTVEETGKILSFNSAAEKLFGYTTSEIIGQPCWQLLPEQYIKGYSGYIQRYLETNNPKHLRISNKIKGLRKDGSTFPSRTAIAPLGVKNESQQHFIISMQDLSLATEKLLGFSRQKTAVAEQLSINTLLQTQQHMLEKP